MGQKDYYEILGADKNASDEELKKLYRKLSLKYHPDRQAGKTDAEKKDAEEKFKEVNEAYSVLSDKEKRARYDQFGTADGGPGFSGFGNGPGGFDPFTFFRKMHAGFGVDPDSDDGFGGFGFGMGGRRRREERDFDAPEDGSDVQMNRPVSVTFKESVFGVKKEFDIDLDQECPDCGGRGVKRGTTPKECPHCHGQGQIVHRQGGGLFMSATVMPCPHCHGSGYDVEACPRCGGRKRIHAKRHVKLTVPRGAYDGMVLRLKGMGQCGVKGGNDGSLYIPVSVGRSDIFVRDENDILLKAYVSPAVATLGGKIEVPTLYGYKKIKIEPGTVSGTKLKVAGSGIKNENGSVGDMIIVVSVEPYANVSDEQKDLLERLQKLEKPEHLPQTAKLRASAAEFYR